jgi:hypothetical protein
MMKNGWDLTFYVICTNQNAKESLNQKLKIKGVAFLKTNKRQWTKLMNMTKLVYNIDWR